MTVLLFSIGFLSFRQEFSALIYPLLYSCNSNHLPNVVFPSTRPSLFSSLALFRTPFYYCYTYFGFSGKLNGQQHLPRLYDSQDYLGSATKCRTFWLYHIPIKKTFLLACTSIWHVMLRIKYVLSRSKVNRVIQPLWYVEVVTQMSSHKS